MVTLYYKVPLVNITNNESYTTGQKFGVGKIRIYLFILMKVAYAQYRLHLFNQKQRTVILWNITI